jgi:hypothetical protein
MHHRLEVLLCGKKRKPTCFTQEFRDGQMSTEKMSKMGIRAGGVSFKSSAGRITAESIA